MSTALSSLSQCFASAQLSWVAGLTIAGFNPRLDPENFTKKRSYTLGSAAGSVNEIYSSLLTITHASSTSLDVTALTDVCGTTINFSAIKGIFIWLLGTADTAPDQSTTGNASSSITIDGTVVNALLSTTFSGWISTATSKFDISNSDFLLWATGSAAGIAVSGTNKVLKINANDGAVDAKVLVSIFGNG